MAKPQKLRAIKKEPHVHVVAKLEEWLAMAKRGEIDGIALAGETTEGTAIYGRCGRQGSRLVGAIAFLQHDLMHYLEQEHEEQNG